MGLSSSVVGEAGYNIQKCSKKKEENFTPALTLKIGSSVQRKWESSVISCVHGMSTRVAGLGEKFGWW